jgi:hypothetical protein
VSAVSEEDTFRKVQGELERLYGFLGRIGGMCTGVNPARATQRDEQCALSGRS